MKVGMMMKNCKGCKEFDHTINQCGTIPDVLMDECPCQECIVKMVCEFPCKKYDVFMKIEVDKYWIINAQKESKSGK